MKALVKTRPEPGLELVEVPDPVAGPNDVIVKVMRTGICGTDVHIDKWDGWAAKTVHTPLVLGHEFCGEIVELVRGAMIWRSDSSSPARGTMSADAAGPA